MARFRRLEALRAILDDGLLPLFYNSDPGVALEVAKACSQGGARALEFTNRGDHANRVFEDLVVRCASEAPRLILGVGSIGDPYTAALYLAAGANFIVGPSFNPDVARLANRRKVPYIPGCGSVTEIAQAEELGSEIVKMFPGDAVGGPEFLKAVLGPSPWSSILPTGGIDASPESIREWIRAGAAALGMGSKLISKDLVERKDWGKLRGRVEEVLVWIKEARAR